jgi:hypothetical protein
MRRFEKDKDSYYIHKKNIITGIDNQQPSHDSNIWKVQRLDKVRCLYMDYQKYPRVPMFSHSYKKMSSIYTQ